MIRIELYMLLSSMKEGLLQKQSTWIWKSLF